MSPMKLSDLDEGKEGYIIDIKTVKVGNRLLSIGFLPGNKVKILSKKFRGIIVVCINGVVFAIRKNVARLIEVYEKEH